MLPYEATLDGWISTPPTRLRTLIRAFADFVRSMSEGERANTSTPKSLARPARYNGDAPEVRLTHQAGLLVRMTLLGLFA